MSTRTIYKKSFLLLFAILLFEQTYTSQAQSSELTSAKPAIVLENEKQIEQLIRQLYRWYKKTPATYEMVPIRDQDGESYIGFNLAYHEKRLKELRATNFFTDEFIENYNRIVLTLNTRLKEKKILWFVGDLQPFGNGSDSWCNCQELPAGNLEDILKINYIKLGNDDATLTWMWDVSEFRHKYKIKVKKVNNAWKISYMQGFDFDEFTKTIH